MIAIIEAAARAVLPSFWGDGIKNWLSHNIVAVVTPLIRDQALEEAAQVADNYPRETLQSSDIGDAIRALKEQP